MDTEDIRVTLTEFLTEIREILDHYESDWLAGESHDPEAFDSSSYHVEDWITDLISYLQNYD